MSSWTTPITFTSSTLTAAQMNTEVRDHLNFLKGALDLITEGSTADTGTATYLYVKRPTSADGVIVTEVTGDSQYRWLVQAGGALNWGSGSAAVDTNLYRSAVSVLKTDSHFEFGGTGMTLVSTGYFRQAEITDAAGAGPAANQGHIYMRDNGSGKTQLVVVFNTGAVQVIATQP